MHHEDGHLSTAVRHSGADTVLGGLASRDNSANLMMLGGGSSSAAPSPGTPGGLRQRGGGMLAPSPAPSGSSLDGVATPSRGSVAGGGGGSASRSSSYKRMRLAPALDDDFHLEDLDVEEASDLAGVCVDGGSGAVGGGGLADEQMNEDRERYCLCRDVSYGEMIGCDSKNCEIEWFHLRCVNLNVAPKGKWYCPRCLVLMRQKRINRK